MSDFDAFNATLATGTPDAIYTALGTLTEKVVGAKLFTLLTFDAKEGIAQRFYSNMPDAYPVSGTKPRPVSQWAETVLDRGETYVMNDIAAIEEVFFDHELIQSLGCESCINIPVIVAGEVLGTMNCLHEAGHYTPDRVALSESLKLPGAACFLLARAKAAGAI
ncbi:MAG: hypothetical protein AcusKO_28590 [Acuticoccus sp.]